jgi:hypothetical protein
MARWPKPWFREDRKAWFVTIEGVRHNLGGAKREAFESFYRLMRQPQRRKVSPHSLAAIIDEFLEWVLKNRSHSNYVNYRCRLQRFVDCWPDLRPDELRPLHVEKWADGFEISRTTRRNYLRAVKRCMRWAKQQGYIDDNPIADLPLPSGESREIVVSPAEFERLLGFVRNDAFRDLLHAAWDTGCRQPENIAVRLSVKVSAPHVASALRPTVPRTSRGFELLAFSATNGNWPVNLSVAPMGGNAVFRSYGLLWGISPTGHRQRAGRFIISGRPTARPRA